MVGSRCVGLVALALVLGAGPLLQSGTARAGEAVKSKRLFTQPADLALDSHGNVWAVDSSLARVIELSPSGKVLRRWGKKGSKLGQLNSPESIGVGPDGGIWVSSQTDTPSLEKFSPGGKFLASRSSAGNVSGLGGRITFDSSSNLWIALGGGVADIPDVIELGPSGNEIAHWQAPHKKTTTKEGIAVSSSQGTVYLSSEYPNAIYKFTSKGKFLGYVAKHGSKLGQVDTPEGLGLDAHGDLFVADQGNSRVEEFSPTGKPLRSFGTFFSTELPQAVAINRQGNIYMLDQGGIRVYRASGKQIAYWR